MLTPCPPGPVFQPKPQMEGEGKRATEDKESLSLGRHAQQVFTKCFSFSPKDINFIICLFDLKQKDLHSSKTEYGHLQTVTESRELHCPAQTKCRAESAAFIVGSGPSLSQIRQKLSECIPIDVYH